MRIPTKALTLRKGKKINVAGKQDVQSLAVAAQIWRLLQDGNSAYEVAIQMGMSTQKVKSIIAACMDEFTEDIQKGVTKERQLDIARTNDLIRQFLPIAKSTTVEVTRKNGKGEPYTDDEWSYSLKAGEIVLKAIETRSKLYGYAKTEGPTGHSFGDNNTLIWLKSEANFVEDLVKSQPLEVPVNDPLDVSLEDV